VDTLTCQELVELITEYFENSLAAAERERFEAHLQNCQGCRNYLDQMRKTIETTGRLTEAGVSPEAQARLLEVFRDWKRTGEG
jgi:predicted anti-sigma-YlaC factor YlaD